MTQEQKDLLLKDLCARLPYNVRVEYKGETYSTIYDVLGVAHGRLAICLPFMSHTEQPLVEEVKPYLFPLSSMTKEQEEEFRNLFYRYHKSAFFFNERFAFDRYSLKDIGYYPCYLQDWLNKNHFDYRGLIPLSLAIDATGLNIY